MSDRAAVALASRALGGAGLPPLLLLHGMLGSSRNWVSVGRELADCRETVALDLRGHGDSPHAADLGYEALSLDVTTWMDGRGWPASALLGHSLGGKTAMRIACRSPGRVERLVVVDIAPRDYVQEGHRLEIAAMMALDLDGLQGREEAEMRLEGRIGDASLRRFLVTNLVHFDGVWRWRVDLGTLAEALPQLELSPLGPGDRYEGPALFVVGEKSNYVTAADHVTIRRHFPGAQIEVVALAGHNPHVDQSAVFVDRVARWLRS